MARHHSRETTMQTSAHAWLVGPLAAWACALWQLTHGQSVLGEGVVLAWAGGTLGSLLALYWWHSRGSPH